MGQSFTVEQVLSLAPDASAASAGKELASPRKWVSLGEGGGALWGECQGSGKTPYQVRVDLSEPAFKCSCPSRKFPCKHGLGALLLWASSPSSFTAGEPPPWVAEWLDARAGRAAKKAERAEEGPKAPADPAAAAKRAEQREARVAAGVDELELWLRDLARRGLAAVKAEPAAFWQRMAARLVDAQAPGLARQARLLSEHCASGGGWEDRAVRQVGRIHLLIGAWRRVQSLPPDTRDDVRAQVGFTQSKEELLAAPGVRDRWFAWAQYAEEDGDGLRVQRTWLAGLESGRMALVLSYARPKGAFDYAFPAGKAHEAELVFYPSGAPLRAIEKSRGAAVGRGPAGGFASLDEGLAAYGAAVGRNPWIELFPMVVRDTRLAVHNGRFLVVDSAGRCLPVRGRDAELWRAFAFTGGHPATVFGEWDESTLRLLALDAGGRHFPVGV
ncbi:MAG: SWIM zinc finger family protein [Candidatus Sumerlaeia bacterium]|nr:SWIM zinc finger family protein [Candidatus Sumerlaeia bacterium]